MIACLSFAAVGSVATGCSDSSPTSSPNLDADRSAVAALYEEINTASLDGLAGWANAMASRGWPIGAWSADRTACIFLKPRGMTSIGELAELAQDFAFRWTPDLSTMTPAPDFVVGGGSTRPGVGQHPDGRVYRVHASLQIWFAGFAHSEDANLHVTVIADRAYLFPACD